MNKLLPYLTSKTKKISSTQKSLNFKSHQKTNTLLLTNPFSTPINPLPLIILMMANNTPGVLIVKPISARLTRDTDTFGKMDPYCIFKIGTMKQTSKTHSSGGKMPKWNDILTFNITNADKMQVEVWDKDSASSDDLVGIALIDLKQVTQSAGSTNRYPLTYKGRSSGEI